MVSLPQRKRADSIAPGLYANQTILQNTSRFPKKRGGGLAQSSVNVKKYLRKRNTATGSVCVRYRCRDSGKSDSFSVLRLF
jgi:hypothetical protein